LKEGLRCGTYFDDFIVPYSACLRVYEDGHKAKEQKAQTALNSLVPA
jgi:hypothetical protein